MNTINNEQSSYFFNGTSLAIVDIDHDTIRKLALTCMMSVLQDEKSEYYKNPKKFGNMLMDKMTLWERTLHTVCGQKTILKKKILKTIKKLKLTHTRDEWLCAWNMNVCMLLILKKIKNSENWGVLRLRINLSPCNPIFEGEQKRKRGRGCKVVKKKYKKSGKSNIHAHAHVN